jgi:hypothetical protein
MQLSRVFYNKINMKWFGVLKKYSISRNILLSSILLAGVYCNRFFFFNLFLQKQLQSSNIIIKSDEPDKICYNDRYFISTLMRHQMSSCVACRFYFNLSFLITPAFYVGWYIVCPYILYFIRPSVIHSWIHNCPKTSWQYFLKLMHNISLISYSCALPILYFDWN